MDTLLLFFHNNIIEIFIKEIFNGEHSRYQSIIKYVIPSVFGQVCIFLFSVIDGIFVGRGVGEYGLGAMGLVTTFTLVVLALYMLTSVGGAIVCAIRLGRGDTNGANDAFMHALVSILGIAVILVVIGTCFTKPLGYLLPPYDNRFYHRRPNA